MPAALAAPQPIEQLARRTPAGQQNPAAVAGIVRGWVGGSEPPAGVALKDAHGAWTRPASRDAAILLMSLGEEDAAEVLQAPVAEGGAKPRRDDRAHEVDPARARSTTVLEQVHARRRRAAASSSPTPTSTSRTVLQQGARRGQGQPADRPHPAGQRHLRHRKPEVDGRGRRSAELLRNEHPQIVAAILVHLDYDQASAVLKLLHRAPAQRGAGAHRHARRHPAVGAEGPERGDGQAAGRRRQAAQGVARRRQGRGRDAST